MKRRDLLRGAVAAVPGAVGLQLLHMKWAVAQSGDFTDPLDVLNYALILEYLEAEYYRQGNESGLLSGTEAEYLATIASDEVAHVAALTSTITQLGGTPVPAPAVDFGASFASREQMLETAYRFENSCMQGYLGAAPALATQPALLQAAAGIYGVEARHAALIGYLAGKPAAGGIFKGPTETPLSRAETLAAVRPLMGATGAMAGTATVTD
jgi:hypothetical protein